ncbi:MAG: CoA pyrophosphatase [Bacteroidales bacterium]|nr:CoA pyrophosphatase [Bacteroidales bacterium]
MAPTYRPLMDESGNRNKAGVTILLYLKEGNIHFPLIERPVYNGVHSGQISFPGGKTEAGDISMIDTSLRECREEIGVNSTHVKVLGTLTELYIPVSKFEVYPVVAYLEEYTGFIPQPGEVSSILEVPLNLILSETILEEKKVLYNGIEETIPFYNIFGKMVWVLLL